MGSVLKTTSSPKFQRQIKGGAVTAVVQINQLEVDTKSKVLNKSSDTESGSSWTASFRIQMLNWSWKFEIGTPSTNLNPSFIG